MVCRIFDLKKKQFSYFFKQFNAAQDPEERKLIRTRLLAVKKLNSGEELIIGESFFSSMNKL